MTAQSQAPMAPPRKFDPLLAVPPSNIKAEQSAIGSVLLDTEAASVLVTKLQAPDFYVAAHRAIFEAIASLNVRGVPADTVTLENELKARGRWEFTKEALIDCVDCVPSAADVAHYCDIVREKAKLRQILGASRSLEKLVLQNADKPSAEVFDKAEQIVLGALSVRVEGETSIMRDLMIEEYERLEKNEPVYMLPSRIAPLDAITGGFARGALTIIAARPAMGKTSLALGIARLIAEHDKTPVAIFSLEMSKQEVSRDMLGQSARVSPKSIRLNKLNLDEQVRIQNHAKRLAELPIIVDTSPELTIATIRAKARLFMAQYRIGLIVLDYLQLLNGVGDEDSRVQEVSVISRGLKQLARELNIPVIALSQLNRSVEMREDKRPKLADLRESGSIEQDADAVIMLYREHYYKPEKMDLKEVAEALVVKNRHGEVGVCKLRWRGECKSFDTLM